MRDINDAPENEPVMVYYPGAQAVARLDVQPGVAPVWRFVGGDFDGQIAPWPQGWEPLAVDA